jgi:hypothetical protein
MPIRLCNAVAFLLMVGLQGCLFAPQPFHDMRIRFERIGLPSDFTLVFSISGGDRGRFAASPLPYVRREYSVPMDREPSVCEELANLLGLEQQPIVRKGAPDQKLDGAHCRFHSKVFAGWRGFLQAIPRYRLTVTARPRAEALPISDVECERILDDLGEQANSPAYGGLKCQVPKDHAIVEIRIYM